MAHPARLLVMAAGLALLITGTGYGQTTKLLPPASAAVPPATPGAVPLATFEILPPTPYVEPAAPAPHEVGAGRHDLCIYQPSAGPPACAPYEDNNGPLLKGSPLLDEPAWAPPGWFGAVDLDIVGPHVKNRVKGDVPVGGGTTTVQLPGPPLDWTVSPRFDLGYRLSQSTGEILASYQFLTTSGSSTLAGFDAAGNPGALHSRLDLQVFDLDYASREPSWAVGTCSLDWKWKVGLRLAGAYFDSRATSPLLEQHTTNDYFGLGPHAGLDLRYCLAETGLALFGRVETALTVGDVHQTYAEAFPGGAPGGAAGARHTQPAPFLGLEAGVTWSPIGNDQVKVTTGYTFQNWWSVGEIDPGSRGDVTVQGVFTRLEWRY
jgi:hypothetical protein